MGLRLLLFAALCCGDRPAPEYAAATVVSAATGLPVLSPNTFATIYGKDLSYSTRALGAADMAGGTLPLVLPGSGVSVFVDGIAAPVWYASPGQINFLIPGNLLPQRTVKVWVARDGIRGPQVDVRLALESPGLFPLDPETVVAVRLDGSLIGWASPASRGDLVVLFATGLGPTDPETPYRRVAQDAAWIVRRHEFRVRLSGVEVPPSHVHYVGLTPGFAGLYQINLQVPADAPVNPEVRIGVGESWSPPGLKLPLP